MLTFTSRTKKSDKMSDSFYTTAHTYLENKLPKILKTTKDITLTPLSGGIMGTTYEFIHPENKESLVVKVENFKDVLYDAFLASDVCIKNNLPYPRLQYFDVKEYLGEKLTIQIMEKMNLPILSQYIKDDPTKKSLIVHAGKMLKSLHMQTTQNYGTFKKKSLAGAHKALISYLKDVYLREEFKKPYLERNYLKKDEVEKLYEVLDNPIQLQNLQPVFCHGDVHLANCFYNEKAEEVIFFDYSSKSMPFIYDLAVYKHKVLSKDAAERWDLFKKGYGTSNVDDDLVDLMMAYLVFRKALMWGAHFDIQRHQWALEFLKDFLKKY